MKPIRRIVFAACVLAMSIVVADAEAQSLPSAVRESDLPRFESALILSAPQRDAVAAILRAMDDEFQPEFQTQRRAMIAERDNLMTLFSRPQSIPEATTALAVWKDAERFFNRMRAEVAARNEEVFTRVHEILAPAQQQAIPFLRLHLERIALMQPLTAIREQNVDLIAMCERITTFDASEYQHVQATIASTLPAFVRCLRNAARSRDSVIELEARAADLKRPFAVLDIAPPQEVEDQVDDLYRQWGKATLPEFRRLVANNRSMLAQFRAGLRPEHAAELQRLYNERAYPEVWPDPGHAAAVHELVRRIPDLSAEQRGIIDECESTYLVQHARLSQQMAEAVYDRGLAWVKREHDVRMQVRAFNDELRRLGLERERLDIRQRDVLATLLLPHQLEQWPTSECNPPELPRPWDPGGETGKEQP